MNRASTALLATAATALLGSSMNEALAQATSAGPPPATGPNLAGEVSRFDPDLLYRGWRARMLLGQTVQAKADGRAVGVVRDLIVDADGRLAAAVIEGGGPAELPTAVYRVPWANLDLTPGRSGVSADLANGSRQPQYGLFPGSDGVATLPREFRLSEVLGDYARLKTGYGYGLVTDAVFTRDGRVSAVLVSRDAASGGGTVAFPFQGSAGPWDPGMSYYGLPFVTEGQAREAGLSVDAKRFGGAFM